MSLSPQPPVLERKTWADQSRLAWYSSLEKGTWLSDERIVIGCRQRVADAAEETARHAKAAAASLAEIAKAVAVLVEIACGRADRKEETPAERKAKLRAASMARAAAVYAKSLAAHGPSRADADDFCARVGRMGVRARKAVYKLGVTTAAELAEKTEEDVLEVRNIGWTTLAELRALLRTYNLEFAGGRHDRQEGGAPRDGAGGEGVADPAIE